MDQCDQMGVTHRDEWPVAGPDRRMAEAWRRAGALRDETKAWVAARQADPRFVRFVRHFDVLDRTMGRMLDAIESELAKVSATDPPAFVYERCRALEKSLSIVRRLHLWYAGKYDQRLDVKLAPSLHAADEIIRSCWSEPFATLGQTPPTGPMAYFDIRFDAMATPRVTPPPDLSARGDEILAEFVRELPVPFIALPTVSVDEPWWLVLCAHETGHHVHHDLVPGLEATTRDVLQDATAAASGSPQLGDHWRRWAQEAFADAFSVLMVGTTAAWAVEELQFSGVGKLAYEPRSPDRYPPPAVRTALLGEVARAAGLDRPGPGAHEVQQWLDGLGSELHPAARDAVRSHLDVTATAARALLDLPVAGVSLVDLCGFHAEAFSLRVAKWGSALSSAAPVITGRTERAAARQGIAGGVSVFRAERLDSTTIDLLRVNIPGELARTGPTGHLAAAPRVDVNDVVDRLTQRLLDHEGGDA